MTVAVRVPGQFAGATLELLQARSLTARAGATLDGQSFGAQTATGRLAGRRLMRSIAPHGQHYVFRLPAASVALVTLAPASRSSDRTS